MNVIVKLFVLLFLFSPMMVFSQEQVDATIDWAHRVDLTIPVDGVVESVNVNTGEKVKKGTVLVKLDSRILRAKLIEADEKVKGLQANYAETNRELTRALELYDRTVLSDHDLQVAKNNLINAQAALASAKSNYVKAKVDLEYSSLKAPFDSIILKRKVEVGQAVFNKLNYNSLITLASSSTFLAKTTLNAKQSGRIKIGKAVMVSIYGKKYSAKIVAIEYGDNSQLSHVVVEFSSQDKGLHAGSIGKITF